VRRAWRIVCQANRTFWLSLRGLPDFAEFNQAHGLHDGFERVPELAELHLYGLYCATCRSGRAITKDGRIITVTPADPQEVSQWPGMPS